VPCRVHNIGAGAMPSRERKFGIAARLEQENVEAKMLAFEGQRDSCRTTADYANVMGHCDQRRQYRHSAPLADNA
jgi:hypothetical protein